MSTQHDGTALTRLYAQLRDNYDELLTERDNLQTMADVAFRELDAVRDERDEARAEADLMYREWRTLHGEQLRVLNERNAYMQALKDIRADHSLVGVAGAVLYRYGRLYPEDGDE